MSSQHLPRGTGPADPQRLPRAEEPTAQQLLDQRDFEAAVQEALGRAGTTGMRARLLLPLQRRWARTMRQLRPLGGCATGNRLQLYESGDEVWREMWRAIRGARERVWLETYILEPDKIGVRTLAELANAAGRGCEVVLLYDALGSLRVNDALLAPLRAAGGSAHAYNPLRLWHRRGPILRRNHRKLLIVDRGLAYCGGLNIGADYAGPELGTSRFRDSQLRIEGGAADELARLYAATLAEIGAPTPRTAAAPPVARCSPEPGSLVQVLESNQLRKRMAIQRTLRATMKRSAMRCWVTSPYFVPPPRLRQAIGKAAARGVDVRVLTAGPSDVPLVSLASQHVYAWLLRRGVRIFEYGTDQRRLLHAKSITIDGVYSMVGSFNFDFWSWGRNLEVNVGVLDPALARELESQFERDLLRAREVRLEDLERRSHWQRFVHALAFRILGW
jgi:cardiolipin synthase